MKHEMIPTFRMRGCNILRNTEGLTTTSTAVFLNGDKAVAETQVMMLSPRINIQGCDMDMQSQAGFFARLVKRDGEWKIFYGDCIYERDELVPATPGTKVPDLAPLVKDYRKSYRNLCYVLFLQGLSSGQDLPGNDKPETVQIFV